MDEGQKRRIDVHHHIAPPDYLAALSDGMKQWSGDFNRFGSWSAAKAIEDMDQGEVATALISITQLGMWDLAAERVRRLARYCNDYAARMVADHKGRFGHFVALPMPDIEGSLSEIAYGLDQLKADGVGLYTCYRDKWLGDPAFAPIFDELERRRAIVYVHPAVPHCCVNFVPGINDASIEYGTDTTRAIARMVFSGAARRYPNVRIIWSHAGGTMPFLIERFIRLAEAPSYAAQMPQGFLPEAQRFFYDTAQASNKVALTAARMVIPADHFVFGTDYPYRTAAEHVEGLAASGVFSAAELRAIDRDNLATLLPRYVGR
jgi:predicted TIM-barrel fold metal-dependent hydrolase